jgi:hypothetical protein
MAAADRIIRWTTAVAVIGVAAIATAVSYEHAGDLVRVHGETGWTARLVPLTVDGLIYASSMVMLDSARRGARVPRWGGGCWLGHRGDAGANVAHGLGRPDRRCCRCVAGGRACRVVRAPHDDHPQRTGASGCVRHL